MYFKAEFLYIFHEISCIVSSTFCAVQISSSFVFLLCRLLCRPFRPSHHIRRHLGPTFPTAPPSSLLLVPGAAFFHTGGTGAMLSLIPSMVALVRVFPRPPVGAATRPSASSNIPRWRAGHPVVRAAAAWTPPRQRLVPSRESPGGGWLQHRCPLFCSAFVFV